MKSFASGREFTFRPGVNVIVGSNGSGKSTLLNLIKKYTLIEQDKSDCNKTMYLYKNLLESTIYDGVDVYSDYRYKVHNLMDKNDYTNIKNNDFHLSSMVRFGRFHDQLTSSSGEGMMLSLCSLFDDLFNGPSSEQMFPETTSEEYNRYVEEHTDKSIQNPEVTVLLDEPDRNLDIDNIGQLKGILSFHKENVQLIATIHNPLLIYELSKNESVNMIELTDGYIDSIRKYIDNLK